jgi:zinc protease
VVFKALTEQMRVQLANQTASPAFVFAQTMNAALTQDHPRARLMTVEDADRISLERSLAFYKDRLADAGGFTFVFVGSFDPATLRPLVERYLASLPATGRHETWKDSGVRLVRGVVEKRVVKGLEPKSEAEITFSGPFQYDQAHRALLRALQMVLDERLRQTLREDLGGTYGVSISPSYTKYPNPQYEFDIDFGCSPDRTDSLVQRVFEEIAKLKAEPPSDQSVSDVRETLLRTLETQTRDNAFFARELAVRYEYGEDLKDLFGLADIYRAITPAMIQDAARTYLDTNNYVKGTLFPEK